MLDKTSYAAMQSAASRGDDLSMIRLLTEGGPGRDAVLLNAASQQLSYQFHEGRTLMLARAAGCIAILPAAVGANGKFQFFQQITAAGGASVIRVANSSDTIQGNILANTTTTQAILGMAAPIASDTITMNGTTTGGIVGGWLELQDVAVNLWRVLGFVVCSGTFVSPYSNAV